MFTCIRILSFAGIFAAPLLYAVTGKISGRAVWPYNVVNLIIHWGIVSAASMFPPLVFRTVTGIVAGWEIAYRTYLVCFDMRCEESIFRYGDLAPYYLSALAWIVLFIMSFF